MAMDIGAAQCQKQSHHIRLDNSIESLAKSVSDLEALATNIRSGTSPTDVRMAAPVMQRVIPSLQEMLEKSPDRIESLAKQVSTLIGELRSMLF